MRVTFGELELVSEPVADVEPAGPRRVHLDATALWPVHDARHMAAHDTALTHERFFPTGLARYTTPSTPRADTPHGRAGT